MDFSEWNGKYRDAFRKYWKGEDNLAAEIGYRLTGSADLFQLSGRGPYASINFITAHDGFTLRDLVSYDLKHNEANLEDNKDGADDNNSWNCGVEGETDDPKINALRDRQVRNFLTTLFVSNGVPMLLAGDELGRTQRGNNNAYCQDNEISWVDWNLDERRKSLLEFTRRLIRMRHGAAGAEAAALLPRPAHLGLGPQGPGLVPTRRQRDDRGGLDPPLRPLAWRSSSGATPSPPPTPYGNKVVGDSLLILMNANHEPVEFVLPAIEWGSDWEILVDTADGDGKTGAFAPAGGKLTRRGPRDDGAPPAGARRRQRQRTIDEHPLVGLAAVQRRVLPVLAVDLGVARRRGHRAQTAAEAGRWVLLWVSPLARLRRRASGRSAGPERGLEFFTAYVIEYALSVDNLFVFLLVFQYFRVGPAQQHLLLFWGVLGAFVLRGTLILGGAALVREFEWLLYLFGAFLLWTAFKLIRSGEGEPEADPAHNPVMTLARRVLPVADSAPEDRFVVRSSGKIPGDAALPGAPGGGDHGPHVRARLHPGGAGGEPRSVRPLHQQHHRGARAALAVLRPQLAPRPAALPEAGAGGGAGVRRTEDDPRGVDPVPVWLSLVIIVGVLLLAFVASWWKGRGQAPSPEQNGPSA